MAAAIATEWAREPSRSGRDPPRDGVVSGFTVNTVNTNKAHHILYHILTVLYMLHRVFVQY
jgi:hypothetical protein